MMDFSQSGYSDGTSDEADDRDHSGGTATHIA